MKPRGNNAKKVFSGQIYDVYQWEQELYDGSTALFEKLARPNTVCVLPIVDDKIILSAQEQPSYEPFTSTIGGRVDPGESDIEAAKRETLEETGLISADWEQLYSVSPVSKIEWQLTCYIARNASFAQKPQLEAGEKVELIEVKFDQLLEFVMNDSFRDLYLRLHLLELHYQNKLPDLKVKMGLA